MVLQDNGFYHINCGVIQGFSALRRAETTYVKKYRIFHVVDIANQLLTRHSPLASLGQVDKWTTKSSRFSIQVVCLSFIELWRLKHYKIRIADRLWASNFSGFGVGISFEWEWKSTTRRFAIGRFWSVTWKTSSVDKNKVNEWVFCKLKITTIVVFSTHFSILRVSANALYDCYSGIVDSFIFIH